MLLLLVLKFKACLRICWSEMSHLDFLITYFTLLFIILQLYSVYYVVMHNIHLPGCAANYSFKHFVSNITT